MDADVSNIRPFLLFDVYKKYKSDHTIPLCGIGTRQKRSQSANEE